MCLCEIEIKKSTCNVYQGQSVLRVDLCQYVHSGLINVGAWPITLALSSSFAQSIHLYGSPRDCTKCKKKPTLVRVYLSEEPHLDVVLERSFIEKGQLIRPMRSATRPAFGVYHVTAVETVLPARSLIP
jgi:hypothetical protein